MERNFILTDLMKTGHHQDYEDFISLHSLSNQSFDMECNYYRLHGYDLESYDRKIAIIDRSKISLPKHVAHSVEYREELERRRKLLHSQGFVFVLSTPWESNENIKELTLYPPHNDEFIWSGGVSWFWFFMYMKHKDKSYNFNHKEKKLDFLYLNKQHRTHRQKLLDQANKNDLLQNSLYTEWPGRKLPKEYELPWSQDYPHYGMDQDIFEKPYNDTACSIVSETNDTNDEIFMTEKIWKAIIAQHVFVVHGNYLYLQKLKEMGFKTFNAFLDEGYDLEMDKDKRVVKIVDTCRSLLSKNWQDIYLQTKALRQHNYDHFFNKEKLSLEINKTLESILEFVDSR